MRKHLKVQWQQWQLDAGSNWLPLHIYHFVYLSNNFWAIDDLISMICMGLMQFCFEWR